MTSYNAGQGFSSQSPIVSEKDDSDDTEKQDGEKRGRGEPSAKKQCCRKTHITTLLFLLYGAMLVALLVKAYYPVPSSSPNCSKLLKAIPSDDVLNMIFAGRWILQEAYSTDSIDQYALTHAKSSWAEFSRGPNGTIHLDMAHMLSVPNRTTWCVYHHFTGIELRNNSLFLDLPYFHSNATFRFIKACNECLVMTAVAFVPGYTALDYLFIFGLYPDLHEYYIRPTRELASCKRLVTPPPFKYHHGEEFCPNDSSNYQSPETRDMDLKHSFGPPCLRPRT